jgi:hypothetical protein
MTAAKFKPLIFSVSGFALSNVANILIFMILDDFCLLLLEVQTVLLYIALVLTEQKIPLAVVSQLSQIDPLTQERLTVS